jgi:DNA-binding response OmpR family regulator
MKRILCIEDDKEIWKLMEKSLGGLYELSFDDVLRSGRSKLEQGAWDLLLLDLSFPDGNGIELLAEIKKPNHPSAHIPVILITANETIEIKSAGFQHGIEDYIVKPFHLVELRLRVEARLRKAGEHRESDQILRAGNISLNRSKQRVELVGNGASLPVDLTTLEFKILAQMMLHQENVLSREQIMDEAWGQGVHVSDRTVDSHICRLRKKLQGSEYTVEAIHGTGYRFGKKAA